MRAYLELIQTSPEVALQRAFVGFRRREGEFPDFAAVSEGVTLSLDEVARLGLRVLAGLDVRPGHVLVGRESLARSSPRARL